MPGGQGPALAPPEMLPVSRGLDRRWQGLPHRSFAVTPTSCFQTDRRVSGPGRHRPVSAATCPDVGRRTLGHRVPQLDGGHHVQDPVDLSVPAAGEPVADVVAGGGVDRGGAGPGSEVALVRDAGDVADLDQEAGGAGGTGAVSISVIPVACTRAVSSLLAAFLR